MNEQMDMFDEPRMALPARLGRVSVSAVSVRSILTRASGIMGDYDFSLNPYAGCRYGCTYCYAAFFARPQAKRDEWGEWGEWVEVKENALAVLRRMRTDLKG